MKTFDFTGIQANMRIINEMLQKDVCELIPSELKLGDKVRFTMGESSVTGFFRYWRLSMNHFNGQIYIVFYLSKVKKDGTESKVNEYFASYNGEPYTMEILE